MPDNSDLVLGVVVRGSRLSKKVDGAMLRHIDLLGVVAGLNQDVVCLSGYMRNCLDSALHCLELPSWADDKCVFRTRLLDISADTLASRTIKRFFSRRCEYCHTV